MNRSTIARGVVWCSRSGCSGRDVPVRVRGVRRDPCRGVMLETRSARAADSVWASKPLPAPHAMANSRHGKAQVGETP